MKSFSISEDLKNIIEISCDVAQRAQLREVSPLCLLVAMLATSKVKRLLTSWEINAEALLLEASDALRRRVEMQKALAAYEPKNVEGAALNQEASNLVRLAALEARRTGKTAAGVEHILLTMLREKHNAAGRLLEKGGMTYENVCERLGVELPKSTFGIDNDDADDMPPEDFAASGKAAGNQQPAGTRTKEKTDTPVIDHFGTDLTAIAAKGGLDPVVGRERETERMVQILCRRKKNNPILIGDPGVGKSAVVEGLAQRIAGGKAPRVLAGKRIVALDMAAIVAGTQYRGQFEERLRKLIEELKKHNEIILFVDEIHTIIGAGSAPGSLDAANILKPALARGEVQCIGATTINEYRKTIEKDGALERRFQKIQLEPATADETLQILHNLRSRYEQHHNVHYTDAALAACVRLTNRYLTDRALPDKAIDALDEAGSRVHLSSSGTLENILQKEREVAELKQQKNAAAQAQDYEKAANLRDQMAEAERQLAALVKEWEAEASQSPSVVDEDQVAAVVSIMSGVPVERVTRSEEDRLRGMKDALRSKVIAQDKAIERVVRSITRSRLGLKGAERPIGTFLFVGPTGVGKTHLVKCLAEWMFGSKDALIRMDMSEYGEKYSVSRLVGAPPGYVGYEEGGQLTEKVRRHPYSVVLLDEIEKAHPDVFNTLLQVMDEGRMTDGNGVTADFRNTIIIMTSNSGTRQLKDFGSGVGFNSSHEATAEQAESIVMKALSKQFAPEFLNRLDDIVMFHPLTADNALDIADLEIRALQKRLDNVPLQLEVTDAARRFLVAKGFDSKYGARSLKRAIHKYLEDNLCDYLMELPADQAKPGVLRAEPNEANDNIKLLIP